MIGTEDRAQRLIELISNAGEIGENCIIEFKAEPHSMDFECEFYKDILALLNSYDRPTEDRWLIYGVANKTFTPIGFDVEHGGLLDDSSYQQKFRRISPRPHIELVSIDGERILGEKGAGKKFARHRLHQAWLGLVHGVRIAAMKADQMAEAILVLVRLLPYSDMAKDAIAAILLPWLPQTEATAASRKGMGTFLAPRAFIAQRSGATFRRTVKRQARCVPVQENV